MTPLLAKRTPSNGWPKTLVDHTFEVVAASEELFGTEKCASRLGESWLRFFRLEPRADWSRFSATLLAACLFHDWGKANLGMQTVLQTGAGMQLFRHEHLSVLMLACDGVECWTHQRSDVDWAIVLAAVGSHHLKFSDQAFAADVDGETVHMLCDHEDFVKILVPLIGKRLGLTGAPEFPSQKHWGFADDSVTFDPSVLRDRLRDAVFARMKSVDPRMLSAVRAALIAADAAGSGLPRTGRQIDWIRERFREKPSCDAETIQGIVQSRIDDLMRQRLWKGWNEFQSNCEELSDRSLLLAPCGSGKTLAAWRWILGQVKKRPVNRVLFLYPTRATATEGFKDYVSWAPEADAALMHGSSEYDLDGMFAAEDPRLGKNFAGIDPRLFAIQHWSKRIVSATVDQFLGFMAYSYGPMCLLPLLADSVIVVDEVHSFDRKMFSALIGFLKSFDVPVLCMTATLPEPKQNQLIKVGLTLSNPRPPDLKVISEAPRYQVMRVPESEAERIATDAAVLGKKRVLWVVNQVSRAQERIQSLMKVGVPVICYHSRFKLVDRRNRHQETVAAMRRGQPAAIVVTTQVCEMSLDIDADVLITEECPITSLIQRMGRCRRGRDELNEKGPGQVFVYKPAKEFVYSRDDLGGLTDFLGCVTGNDAASQADLEVGLDRFGPKSTDAPKLNSFLASGPYAMGGDDSFRDIDEFNVQAVLSNEVEDYVNATPSLRAGFILPVPKKIKPASDHRLPRHLFIADSRHYCTLTGFWDKPIH